MVIIMIKKELSTAWRIGSICIITYLASYVTRNILSVSTPDMLKDEFFTKEYTGMLSSVCFIFYAIGQLVNGFLGERIHPKMMISIGLLITSISTLTVPAVASCPIHFICFTLIGFALSMLRGPMMKVISENTEQKYARIICSIFCIAGFAGPLVASIFSMFFRWKVVFLITGTFTAVMAAASAVSISLLCKQGLIKFVPQKSNGIGSIFEVFKLKYFVTYMLLNAIAEIAGSSVTFWVPTYTTEHLGLSAGAASAVYTIVSFSTLFSPFIALFIYEKISRNGPMIAAFLFAVASVMFLGMRFVTDPIANIILLLLAKVSAGSAAGVIWSVYIPSLGRSGKSSSANGVIDAAAYAAASAASAVFSVLVSYIGWNGLKLLWCALMVLGMLVPLIGARFGKKDPVSAVK